MSKVNCERINWGILGAGNISSSFATALNGVSEGRLCAVAARSKESAEKFAKKYHAEVAYGSYEELMNDENVDVIYIGTIHTMHYEQVKACIHHGKSVFCEKPFTLNAVQTKEIMDLAQSKGVYVMEAMWTKFLPVTQKVKQWIGSGAIGEVKYIQAEFGFASTMDENSRIFDINKAGGALLDVGIYPITYACHLLDQMPKTITSTMNYTKTGVDATNVVIMKFENGAIANVASSVEVEMENHAIITGTKGKIIVPDFWYAQEAYLYGQDQEEHYEVAHPVNGYEYEAKAVMQDLKAGKLENTCHPLQSTFEIIELMDQLRREWGLCYPAEKE